MFKRSPNPLWLWCALALGPLGCSGEIGALSSDPGGSGGGGGLPAGSCLAHPLLASLGVNGHLLAGASMSDEVAGQGPFDLRYLYLAGGLFSGTAPCGACDASCSPDWWGCWQDTSQPPGDYTRSFVAKTHARSQLPMVTYYILQQGSGANDGVGEVASANDAAFMTRYFADYRFFLQQLGSAKTLVHLEPDFWGYAQHVNADPHAIPATVASANSLDCAAFENSIAGMGRCLISMARAYAPNARVGLHASAWASGPDVTQNTDPSLDVAAEATKVGNFLAECGGAGADFVAVEASDRDSGYYDSQGRNTWWDATNQSLPSFDQAFAWTRAVAERLGRPVVWWQLPVGNTTLGNVDTQWKDNRVDYFFAHPEQVARAHGAAMLFGAGQTGQTTPSTDNGYLVAKIQAFAASPPAACP